MTKEEIRWIEGDMPGVFATQLTKLWDDRGSLCEVFRKDSLRANLSTPVWPEMGYLSYTNPGIVRGPHAHRQQTDVFVFAGAFHVYLWLDTKAGLATTELLDPNMRGASYIRKLVVTDPIALTQIVVPPGIVHAYKNVGAKPAMSLNFPNQLYKGWDKRQPVDEIRFENEPETIYVPWT